MERERVAASNCITQYYLSAMLTVRRKESRSHIYIYVYTFLLFINPVCVITSPDYLFNFFLFCSLK